MNELPELATLPVLNETEAAILRRDLGTLAPDLQERAKQRLGRYDNEQQSKLFAAFDDPSKLPDTGGWFTEAERLRPGEGVKMRKKEAVANFYAREYGTTTEAVLQDFDAFNYDYGARVHNEPVPLEPERMFERIKPAVAKQREEKQFTEALDDDAFQYAFESQPYRVWLEQAKTKPGFDPKKTGEYLSRWNEVQREAKTKLGEHIPLVRQVLNVMKQEVGQGEDTSEGADYWKRPVYELNALASEDPEAYKKAMSALEFMARREAVKESDKGTPQATGEALYRGVQRILGGAVNATQAVVGANVAEAVGADEYAESLRGLSKVDNDLRRIAQRVLDPTMSPDSPWWRKMFVGGAESAPSMLASMNKPVGLPLLLGSYVNDARETFRERGWEGKDADASALVVGVAMSAIEKISELPFVDKFTAPLRARLLAFGGDKLAGRFVVNAVMRYPTELLEEFGQDLTPSAVQAVVGSVWAAVPSVDLQKEAGEWIKNNLGDVALITLPLALLGAGVHTVSERDRASLDAWTADEKNLAILGEAKAKQIAALPFAERLPALQSAWQAQDKAQRVEWLKAQSTVQRELAKLGAQEQARQMREAEAIGVSMRWNGQAWNVTLGNGQVVQADTEQAARVLVQDLRQSADEDAATAMLEVLQGTGSDVTVSGESLSMKGGKLLAVSPSLEVREVNNPKQLEAIRSQARSLGYDEEVEVEINGSNEVFADEVGRVASRIVLQRSTQQPLTVTALHEGLEANLKRGIVSGALTEKGLVDALAVVAGVLDRRSMRGTRKDSADETSLRERLDAAASGQLEGAALRELAIEVAVGEVIGRDRRGKATGFAPGAVSRALDAELLAGRDVATMTALQKLKAWLSAVRTYIRGVLGVVRSVDKARASGKLADGNALDSFIDDLLGLNESKFSKAVEAEAGAMLGEASSHSLSSAELSARVERAAGADALQVDDVAAWEGLHWKERSKRAKEKAKELKAGAPVVNADRGKTIQVSVAGMDHWSQFSNEPRKAALMGHMRELLEKAVFLRSEKPDARKAGDQNLVAYHRLALPVRFGSDEAVAMVVLQEDKAGHWVYDGRVLDIEMPADGLNDSSELSSRQHSDIQQARIDVLTERLKVNEASVTQDSFSLSPVRRMELVENRLAVVLNQDSEQARKFAERANDRLGRLKSRYAGVPAPKSKAELDKQQAGMAEARRAELEEMMVGEVEHRMGGVHGLVTKLREHPLGDYLLRSDMRRKRLYLGSLMPPARWRAEQLVKGGPIPGDYDSAGDIPDYFFRGDGRPDDVAKEAFGLGLLDGDSTDDLWNGIGSMLNELATNKEQMQKYREQLREARQNAKEEAEYEGRAWRAEEDEKQAFLANPRDAAMRDVASLDAITMAMPAEARAKLPRGLNAMVAGAKTDKAFADVMTKAVRAVDAALNDYWKGKNIESMNTLVMLGQGKTTPGKKPKGTATPAVHSYFEYAAKVAMMTPDEASAERLKVDKLITDHAGKADESLWIERGQILDTWGAFASLHVAAQSQALEDGWNMYRTGRNAWRASEDARLYEQRAEAADLIKQVGQGTYERISKAAGDATGEGGKVRKAKALKTWAGKVDLETRDFEGVLSALLGRDHPITKRWAKQVRDGLAKKDDAMRALRRRWQSALDLAMPGMGHSKQRKRLWQMRSVRILEVDIAEEESRADLTAEERDALRESGGLGTVASKVKLTEDEAIFITMTARQKQYVDPLAMAGYTPAVIASLESRITPEGKALREFLAAEYDAGHAGLDAVMQRVQGIKLPKIPNYSPGRFYNWGNEKPLDVMGTGVVNAGFASGFLIDRRAHAAQVKLVSALGVFWTHQNESLHWQALAEPVRAMRGVLRNPDVKRSLDGAWGVEGNALLEQWMQALEGNGIKKAGGAWDKLINAASSNFAMAKLGYNVGTIAKQSLAVLNTALDVPFGMWVMGAGEVMQNPGRFREVFESDFIQRRLDSGFSPEVRTVLDRFWSAEPGMSQEVMEKGMEFLGFADAFFTSVSAAVAYEAHARMAEKAGMSPDQAHIIGMEKAAEAVSKTSQPQTVATRSMFELQMSHIARLSFMFMTEARQKASLWLEAQGRLWTGKASTRDKNLLFVSHLLIAPMLQAITSALKDWRDGPDDGDDDPAWEVTDFLVAAMLGPIDGIPFVGSAIKDGIAGRTWGGKGSDVLGSPITGILTVGGDLFTDLFDEKDQTLSETVNKILRMASQIGGPAGVAANIYKQGQDTIESFQ